MTTRWLFGTDGPQDHDHLAARAAPWLISLLFHIGLALAMMLIALIVLAPRDEPVSRPGEPAIKANVAFERIETDLEPMGPVVRPVPGIEFVFDEHRPDQAPLTPILAPREIAEVEIMLPPRGGGPGELGPLNPSGPGVPGPGTVNIIGIPLPAEDVIYVIDMSGSMNIEGAFDVLRLKLAQSIAGLKYGHEYIDPVSRARRRVDQRFHLIFFGPREPVENSPRRLVPATEANKRLAAGFLSSEKIKPEGDTLVLPALARAFELLRAAEPKRRKAVFLLSDGGFENTLGRQNEYKGLTGNEAVRAYLRDNNVRNPAAGAGGSRRLAQIYTCLYRGDEAGAKSVMQQIAEDHGGQFKHVSRDEL